MEITEVVTEVIRGLLPDAHIEVRDPMQDGRHLSAVVVAKEFEGLPLFKQHQMIMRALKDHFNEALHALQLTTMTPSQWEQKQS